MIAMVVGEDLCSSSASHSSGIGIYHSRPSLSSPLPKPPVKKYTRLFTHFLQKMNITFLMKVKKKFGKSGGGGFCFGRRGLVGGEVVFFLAFRAVAQRK